VRRQHKRLPARARAVSYTKQRVSCSRATPSERSTPNSHALYGVEDETMRQKEEEGCRSSGGGGWCAGEQEGCRSSGGGGWCAGRGGGGYIGMCGGGGGGGWLIPDERWRRKRPEE
jgi:hypothetical protein